MVSPRGSARCPESCWSSVTLPRLRTQKCVDENSSNSSGKIPAPTGTPLWNVLISPMAFPSPPCMFPAHLHGLHACFSTAVHVPANENRLASHLSPRAPESNPVPLLTSLHKRKSKGSSAQWHQSLTNNQFISLTSDGSQEVRLV